MAEKNKSIIESALLDAKRIQEALNANTKEILRSVAIEEIDGLVKESLEEGFVEEDAEETDVEVSDDESTEELEDVESSDEEEGEESEEGEELELDDEGSMEGDDLEGGDEFSMSAVALGGDDEVKDMTTASMDDVIKVYKELTGDDEIEVVVDDESGDVKLTVNQPGTYVIKTENGDVEVSDDDELEIGGFEDEERMEDETMYEIELDEDDMPEGLYENEGGDIEKLKKQAFEFAKSPEMDKIVDKILNSAKPEDIEQIKNAVGSLSEGMVGENDYSSFLKIVDKAQGELNENAEVSDLRKSVGKVLENLGVANIMSIGMLPSFVGMAVDHFGGTNFIQTFSNAIGSGSAAAGLSVIGSLIGGGLLWRLGKAVAGEKVTGDTPLFEDDGEETVDETMWGARSNSKRAGFSHKPESAKRQNESVEKYNTLLTEAKELRGKNEEYKEALKQFRTMLAETVVFNSNLTYVTKLFMEHSTTKEEKQSILKRFDNEVSTLKESKKLYRTIVSELSSKKTMNESIDKKLNNEVSSSMSKQLNESTAYIDKETQRIKDLMSRVEKR